MKSFVQRIISKYFQVFQFLINIRFTRKKIAKYQHLFSGKLLDVGAGDKPYKELFSKVNEYCGTNTRHHYEINDLIVDEAHTDVWIDDASKLPFDDNSFDGVVCFQVLSLIQEPKQFFKEVARILKPEGYFMLTTDFLYPKWKNDKLKSCCFGYRWLILSCHGLNW